MGKNIPEQIRRLVKQNNSLQAAEVLSKSFLKRDAILLIARIKKLEEGKNQGLLHQKDINIETNLINKSLLNAAEQLEKHEGFILNKYLTRDIIIGLVIFIVMGVGIGFMIYEYYLSPLSNSCDNNSKYVLGIADFTEDGNRQFKRRLIANLDDGFSPQDSVFIQGINRFIEFDLATSEASINEIGEEKCIDHGILMHGQLVPKDTMIDCYIHLIHLDPINIELIDSLKKIRISEVNLKSPHKIHFSTPLIAQIVSDFVIGLMKYYLRDFKSALKYLKRCQNSISRQPDSSFTSPPDSIIPIQSDSIIPLQSDSIITSPPDSTASFQMESRFNETIKLLIGNSYLLSYEIDSAISIYQQLIDENSNDPQPYWNLGMAYIMENRIPSAQRTLIKYSTIVVLNEDKLTPEEDSIINIIMNESEDEAMEKIDYPENLNSIDSLLEDNVETKIESLTYEYEVDLGKGANSEIDGRKIINREMPIYNSQEEGEVTFHLTVAPNGSVIYVYAITTKLLLKKSGIEAIKKWRFNALPSGQTQNQKLSFTMEFKLK